MTAQARISVVCGTLRSLDVNAAFDAMGLTGPVAGSFPASLPPKERSQVVKGPITQKAAAAAGMPLPAPPVRSENQLANASNEISDLIRVWTGDNPSGRRDRRAIFDRLCDAGDGKRTRAHLGGKLDASTNGWRREDHPFCDRRQDP